jgi:hypothetical protein
VWRNTWRGSDTVELYLRKSLFCLLCLLPPLSVGKAVGSGTLVLGAEDLIPDGEEGLREVGLDSPCLMMDVVVCGIVAGDELQRVPREVVATVVVHSLHSGEAEEECALADAHSHGFERSAGSEGVKKESLNWMVVQSAIGIRHVEPVVSRVPFCYCQLSVASST